MGGRLIRRWISEPLLDIGQLQSRQQIISELLASPLTQARLAKALKKAGDIERLINRVRRRIATRRGFVARASGLRAASEVQASLPADAGASMPSGAQLVERLANNDDVIQLIESALVDAPPLSPSEGGVMRSGYSAELDQVKEASQNGQKWITGMEQRERKRTGISTLKVSYPKDFAYFIEVSNSQLS